jgi:hypothetical protein
MSRIEKLVIDGMVIDERGTWIPLTEKVAREREFLSHLEKGEVLFEKKWISIEQRKAKEENTAQT